ncbi:trimethylamine methyltransferase family protein [Mesorhizobium sp. M0809]|uniref:trimethylamine methyltransferase family protein n=1 Tax=Mesorhizobium sp. M0809 TaxID=2957003 RepID=UPI003337B08E
MAGRGRPGHHETRAEYARLLSEYQEPKLDEAKDEALRDYIARREREFRRRMNSIRATDLLPDPTASTAGTPMLRPGFDRRADGLADHRP